MGSCEFSEAKDPVKDYFRFFGLGFKEGEGFWGDLFLGSCEFPEAKDPSKDSSVSEFKEGLF